MVCRTATARRVTIIWSTTTICIGIRRAAIRKNLGPTSFTLPPQSLPTIADVMTSKGVSWKYYSGDRGNDPTVFANSVDGVPLLFHFYCGICGSAAGYLHIIE